MKYISKKNLILFLISGFIVLFNSHVFAGDDPSIKGDLRKAIQASMDKYIKHGTINGIYYHYDPVKGKLLKLKLGYIHSGIVKKGDFYVSCADMIDQKTGTALDMDFFVADNFGKLVTTQGIVHKADGVKRKYDLENVK